MSKADEIRAKMAELQKELAAEEAKEAKSKLREEATRRIKVIGAFKAAYSILKEQGSLGPAFDEIAPQALPKASTLARQTDMSETERSNAEAEGHAAIDFLYNEGSG